MSERKKMDPKRLHDQLIITGLVGLIEDEGMMFHEAMEVLDDINRMKTLNTSQSQKRKEMHVCPLQIDIVERIINRYSNPGEVVLDPFGGLMTVPYCAVKVGRKGFGIELNVDYFRDGVGYLKAAEAEIDMPTLFDFEELKPEQKQSGIESWLDDESEVLA